MPISLGNTGITLRLGSQTVAGRLGSVLVTGAVPAVTITSAEYYSQDGSTVVQFTVNDGGSAVTGYEYLIGGGLAGPVSESTSGGVTTATFEEGSTAGGTITVSATNANGTGTATATIVEVN